MDGPLHGAGVTRWARMDNRNCRHGVGCVPYAGGGQGAKKASTRGTAFTAKRTLMAIAAACVSASMTAPPAAAHPHMFFDATAQFVTDTEARLTAVRVAFIIDEYNSLLTVAELGLDADADGALSEAEEQTALSTLVRGFSEYDYFAELTHAAGRLKFNPPTSGAAWLEDGHLGLVMDLPLADPQALAGKSVTLALYDPTYFTQITMALAPQVEAQANGETALSCTAQLKRFEENEELADLSESLAQLSREETPEQENVGAFFADRATLNCGG